MESKAPSRLLGLPPELRIMIYEFVFEGNEVNRPQLLARYLQPALTMVNKQIHLEATPIFYRNTTFYSSKLPRALAQWLAALPTDYLNKIKSIRCQTFLDRAEVPVAMECWKNAIAEAKVALADGKILLRTQVKGAGDVWSDEFGTEFGGLKKWMASGWPWL